MKTFIKINFNYFHRLSKKKYFNLLIIVSIGLFFRLFYLLKKTGDIFLPNLGGDSCHHYNMAYNIASGIGPKTSFIFSYWFYHDHIPAMTDVYAPGYSYFLSLFLFIKDEFFFFKIIKFGSWYYIYIISIFSWKDSAFKKIRVLKRTYNLF